MNNKPYEIIILILISSIKFIFAFPVAKVEKFSFHETILYTSAGGILGILFFGFITDELIKLYKWFIHVYMHNHPNVRRKLKAIKIYFRKLFPLKKRNIFSKRTKRFIRIKNSCGLYGIAILTPLLLSIPIGTFLAIRFYKRTKKTIFILSLFVIIWSLIFSSIIYFTSIRY